MIAGFNEIWLERPLTGPELDRVRAAVNDRDVLAAVDHYGLAEYLGAGPVARKRFEKVGVSNSPVGHALVQVAIDWRRTGLIRPVSEQILTTMLPAYLTDRPDVPRTSQAIEEGLNWATEKINATVALLDPNYTDPKRPVFKVLDYLLDQLTSTSPPVPELMWTLALEQSEPAELNLIGLAAYHAGKLDTAATAYSQAIASGDAIWVPEAAYALGTLLAKHDDVEGAKDAYQGAKAAYQRVLDSHHAIWAPAAAVKLGELLAKQEELLAKHDDIEGAKDAYRWAIANALQGDDVVPEAACYLGELLAKHGDFEGAKDAYQWAIASGDAVWAPEAAYALGTLLAKHDDVEGAKAAYQLALDSHHAFWAPEAAYILGELLSKKQGDFEGAKAFYQQAITSRNADTAPKAAVALGTLLAKQGDFEGAKAAYQLALDSHHAF